MVKILYAREIRGKHRETPRAVATLERDRYQSQEKSIGMVEIDLWVVSRNLLPTWSGAMLLLL